MTNLETDSTTEKILNLYKSDAGKFEDCDKKLLELFTYFVEKMGIDCDITRSATKLLLQNETIMRLLQ